MANSQKHTNKFSKISVLKTDGLAMELRSAHSPKDTEKSKVHKGSEDELSHFKKKKRILLLFGSYLSVQLINQIRKMGTKIASLQLLTRLSL